MSLPDNVSYWLLTAKKSVAAEVPASQLSRRAWIRINPLPSNVQRIMPSEAEADFSIRYFEIEKDILETAQAEDRYIENEERLSEEILYANNETELEFLLSHWLKDFNKLVLPFSCDYPPV